MMCARAREFYFRDDLYQGTDNATGSDQLDLQMWKDGYLGNSINANLYASMYFL